LYLLKDEINEEAWNKIAFAISQHIGHFRTWMLAIQIENSTVRYYVATNSEIGRLSNGLENVILRPIDPEKIKMPEPKKKERLIQYVTEGGNSLEYVVGGFSSTTSSFCIRVEESQLTTNSFSVNWSAKVSNSFFIQDCYDVMDCMFCSHISGKRFCIANMQFEEEEYKKLKLEVVRWILTS
jgi:hypothetical protein